MGFTIREFIEIARILIMYLLGIQFMFGLGVLLLERIMINTYVFDIDRKSSNFLEKTLNIISMTVTGSAYFIYKKVAHYNWFLRKIFFAIALFVQGVLSIVIYQIIYRSMKAVFL